MNQTNNENTASLFKALGHPSRVMILNILINEGQCISGDLADKISLAPSTISEHLRILKECNLINGTIDGPRRSYCVNPVTLETLSSNLMELSKKAKQSSNGCN